MGRRTGVHVASAACTGCVGDNVRKEEGRKLTAAERRGHVSEALATLWQPGVATCVQSGFEIHPHAALDRQPWQWLRVRCSKQRWEE